MKGVALIVIGSLCFAAYRDFVAREIPDWVSILCAGLFVVAALVFLETGSFFDGLKLAGPVFLVTLILFSIGQFGGGDVKLLTATSLWAGFSQAIPFLVIISITGGILSLGYLIRKWIKILLLKREATQDALDVSADVATEPVAVPYGIAIAIGTSVILVNRFLI